MIEVTLEQKQELVNLLLKCPSIMDVKSRSTIMKELPPHIANAIQASGINKEHVLNIVNTCMNHADGLELLLERVRFFDTNTIPFQKLIAFIDKNFNKNTGTQSVNAQLAERNATISFSWLTRKQTFYLILILALLTWSVAIMALFGINGFSVFIFGDNNKTFQGIEVIQGSHKEEVIQGSHKEEVVQGSHKEGD